MKDQQEKKEVEKRARINLTDETRKSLIKEVIFELGIEECANG